MRATPAKKIHPDSSAKVTLRKITGKTVRSICDLSVSDDQKDFVAPNAVSIAQAYFSKAAWFRAVYADSTPVGFLMLAGFPSRRYYYLWRFMIDAKYQGNGYGSRALELIIKRVRRLNGKSLYLSIVRAKGGAEDFYKSFGFCFTGKLDGIEHVMKLDLRRYNR